jgi:hypothetical protein
MIILGCNRKYLLYITYFSSLSLVRFSLLWLLGNHTWSTGVSSPDNSLIHEAITMRLNGTK